MPAMPFEANVRHLQETAIIDLRGDINRQAEHQLIDAVDSASSSGRDVVVLNFSGVGYINSTGIAVIVGILARARSRGQVLHVFGLSEHYRTIFEITRLADFMQIFPDEQSAVER